jgi:hypothetical protein
MMPLAHAPATVIKLYGDYAGPQLRNTREELAQSPEPLESAAGTRLRRVRTVGRRLVGGVQLLRVGPLDHGRGLAVGIGVSAQVPGAGGLRVASAASIVLWA